jgi:hypothetical protein
MPAKLEPKEKRRRAAERARTWYNDNKQRAKAAKLKKAYGLSFEDYTRLLEINDGGCVICDSKCPSGRGLAVDHDHKTGVVRGLLCINCNKGLGNFKDNPSLLKEAIQYLEYFEQAQGEQNAFIPRQVEEIFST